MRHILLLGLSALPLAAHADATDLMAIVNPALADSRPTFRIGATGFAADDFVPAHRIADPWRDAPDPRPGRNLAIGYGRLEASQSWDAWTIGTYRRVDAIGEGNRDTVRVYYAFGQPDTLLGHAGNYTLDYRFKGYSADGVRLAWSTTALDERLRFGAALNLLKAGTLRVERVSGTAVSTNGVATVVGRRQLLYTGLDYTSPGKANLNDFAPAARQSTDNGWGQALDLGMQWLPRDDLRINVAVNDLFGQLHWKNVPELTQDFNSASWPLEFNSPTAQAKITGINRYRDYTQQLKPKAAASIAWSGQDWELGASIATTRGLILAEANASFGNVESGILRLSYEPRFRSLGANVGYGPFFAGLRTESGNLNESRAIGTTAGLVIQF